MKKLRRYTKEEDEWLRANHPRIEARQALWADLHREFIQVFAFRTEMSLQIRMDRLRGVKFDLQKPAMEDKPNPNEAMRTCLHRSSSLCVSRTGKDGGKFLSSGPGNRKCPACTKSPRAGYSRQWEGASSC